YQKRAPAVIDWLAGESARSGRRWMVRLVKGAYWDTEVKRAQERGLEGYPVYTRKAATDVCYMASAKALLANAKAFYPQFATHNALTIAYVLELAGARRDFEFQRLHGMGEALYRDAVDTHKVACRVYAPVGSHEDLLPYLVRRLLENGANSSFVNRITDESVSPATLVADPVATVAGFDSKPHPRIPQPSGLFGTERKNSMGVNLANDNELAKLAESVNAAMKSWHAAPLVPGAKPSGLTTVAVSNPADRRQVVGQWQAADSAMVELALANAQAAFDGWDHTPAA